MTSIARAAIVVALLLTFGPGAHAGVQTGVRVIPSYGSSDLDNGVQLDLAALPVTFILRSERLSLRATLPYLQVTTEIPVYYIGGPNLRFPIGGQTIHEEGPGDLVLTPSVLIYRGDLHRPWVWGGARLKVPTADEDKRLGTGEVDYGPSVGLLQPAGDRLLLYATARYDVRGDPPGTDLHNTFAASLAGRLRVRTLSGVTLGLSRTEAAFLGGEPSLTASTFIDHFFRQKDLSLHAGVFSNRSGEASGYGIAVGFTYRDDPLPWGA
jgi:hypothetical protein